MTLVSTPGGGNRGRDCILTGNLPIVNFLSCIRHAWMTVLGLKVYQKRLSDEFFRTLYDSLQRMFTVPPPRRLYFRRCLILWLLATLRKNFRTDLHEIFRDGWQWAPTNKWSNFPADLGSDLPDGGTDIATLVGRILVEVCTVPVLIVSHVIDASMSM